MGTTTPQASRLWWLSHLQHGVLTRGQMLAFGYSPAAIRHRIAKGRLHPVHRGVYAVGLPELSRYGTWMAAVLSCGPRATLSHASAGALWGIGVQDEGGIEVSVRLPGDPRPHGIVVHRRASLRSDDVTRRHGIPVTSPVRTLVDLTTRLGSDRLEAAVNEADR
jgi:hypothetical protein